MSVVGGSFLDADIARTLWKALVVHDAEKGESYLIGDDWQKVLLPHFSTNVDDAYRVVGHLQSQGWTLNLQQDIQKGVSKYIAAFVKMDGRHYIANEHESLPMVLCLAALAAYSGLNIKRV